MTKIYVIEVTLNKEFEVYSDNEEDAITEAIMKLRESTDCNLEFQVVSKRHTYKFDQLNTEAKLKAKHQLMDRGYTLQSMKEAENAGDISFKSDGTLI